MIILVHFLFWLIVLFLIYLLLKCHEYVNALVVVIGAIFMEKLDLIELFFNISSYQVILNYFYWLLKSNSLISLIGTLMTLSIVSKLMSMFKQWIKIGVLIAMLYWFGS